MRSDWLLITGCSQPNTSPTRKQGLCKDRRSLAGRALALSKPFHSMVVIVAISTAMLAPLPQARACPFCPAALMTLSEQLEQSNAAVLAKWVEGDPATEDKPGTSTYQVQRVVKGPKHLVPGLKVTSETYQTTKPGSPFFLMGATLDDGRELEWVTSLAVTEASFHYIAEAPPRDAPSARRLAYYLKFLESSDPMISNDAFAEFANAEYSDVEKLSSLMPKEKIRQWIANPQTPAIRLGLYGMMIGLCGDDSDARELEKRILQQKAEFRLGMDGLMGGYLLLRKEKGLDVLDEHKLRNKTIPFSETFSAMQALRFMWTYGTGRIAPERLKQSMRILLDRPEMADLVIADLARWKDWSIQDQLMRMYGDEKFHTPSIKLAIVRYMLVSAKHDASDDGATIPAHVTHGEKLLDELRTKDAKLVSDAERFFVVP